MILHFFPRHPMVFFISSWEDLRGFDFINYIYIQTQTNLAGWCPKVLKSTCNCMAKTDHSGQRKGKNRNFPDFINSLWSIVSQVWSLSKHAKLNIYFLNLANSQQDQKKRERKLHITAEKNWLQQSRKKAMTNRIKFTSHCRIAAKMSSLLFFPARFAHARYSSRMIDRFLNWGDHGKPKSGKIKGRCQPPLQLQNNVRHFFKYCTN